MLINAFIGFVFGLIYGSFLNVLLWRLPEEQGIGGRSHCRHCGHVLAWYDLVPVFSFLALQGRCRYCKTNIHIRYPIVELTLGILLALLVTFGQFVSVWQWVFAIYGLLVLASLFFFDLFYFILPDVLVLPGILVFLIADLFWTKNLLGLLFSTLLITGFFAMLWAGSKGKQLGFGDVKLALLISLMLGYPLNTLSVILGIWIGGIASLILLATKRATLKQAVPLGAFLCAAAIFFIIAQHETAYLWHFLP